MSLSTSKPLTATLLPLLLALGAVPLIVMTYDGVQTRTFERRCTAEYEATQPPQATRPTILFVFGKGAERLPKPTFAQMYVSGSDVKSSGATQAAQFMTCAVTPEGTVTVRFGEGTD
ncbi:hypothetical protein [Deinococcus sp. AJ005]|uniref:hypothetical protein n=1 Tax=Deinococcus sp. AJ005 TaxID=2652443 RepID=UPI00125CAD83|nr:hypothetical protein [Deinococcus sp. AJ005]QFP78527.1 hypothetical protein DAAJ005_18305 [Deinococcus sp. AJ005]